MDFNDRSKVMLVLKRLDNLTFKRIEQEARIRGIDEVALMHGYILHYLYDNREQVIYQKDIEKFFAISRSNVTSILKALEKKGFIQRESVDHDARLKKVTLTETGARSQAAVRDMFREMDQKIIEGIDPAELDVFLKVCNALKENIMKKEERSEDL